MAHQLAKLATLVVFAMVNSGVSELMDCDDWTCPTTSTASTTIGVSLMQAMSARAKFESEVMTEDLPKQDTLSNNVQATQKTARLEGDQTREDPPKQDISSHHVQDQEMLFRPAAEVAMFAPKVAPERAHRNGTFSVKLVAYTASSLVQHSSALAHDAVAQLASSRVGVWCGSCLAFCNAQLTSMGVTGSTKWFLIIAILLMVNLLAVWAIIYHPELFGAEERRQPQVSHFQSPPTEELIAKSKPSPQTTNFRMTDNAQRREYSGQPGQILPSTPQPQQTTPIIRGRDQKIGSSSDDERAQAGAWRRGMPPPRAGSLGSPTDSNFCNDLIVPQHMECILVLPLDTSRTRTSFEITDVNGSPVLRVVPQQPAGGRLWRATVTSSSGELLAQCCEASRQAASTAEGEFHLIQANGQYFAKLIHNPTQDRYLVSLLHGGALHIWGLFDNHSVNITDDANRLFATTEVGPADFDPQGRYCRLRVAPLADAGLALCGILCVGQHMRNQGSRTTV